MLGIRILFTRMIGLVIVLSSCQNKSSDSGKKDATVPLSPSSLTFPRQYFFSDPTLRCETPNVQVGTLQDFCLHLRDDSFNRNCARSLRDQNLQLYCNSIPVVPVNPNPNGGGDVDPIEKPNHGRTIRCVTWTERTVANNSRWLRWNWKLGNGGEVQILPWTSRSNIPTLISNSYGRIFVRMEPSRIGGRETMEISIRKADESLDYSVKGFAGRELTLQVEDTDSNRTTRITCSANPKSISPNKVLAPIACAGKISSAADGDVLINRTITYADLGNSNHLLDRPSPKVEDIEFNAYSGQAAGDESMNLDLRNVSRWRNVLVKSSLREPLELKITDRRISGQIELRCSPPLQ